MKNKYNPGFIINFLIIVVAIVFLFFLGGFWIGSEEQYLELMAVDKTSFIVENILFSWLCSLLILLIIGSILWAYNRIIASFSKKLAIKHFLFWDLIILLVVSVVGVLFFNL